MLGAIVFSANRRPEWAIFHIVVLAALPNLWQAFREYPLGKDVVDLLFAAGFLGVITRSQNGPTGRPASSWVIVLFLIASYLSLWNVTIHFSLPLPITTANPLVYDWKNYAEMILLYYLAYYALRDESSHRTLVFGMTAILAFIALRGVMSFVAGESFSYAHRFDGPFWIVGLNANHFGAFIAHFAAMSLGLALGEKTRWRWAFYLGTAMLCVHSLFFSYSRGAYLGALAALMTFGLLRYRAVLVLVVALVLGWQTLLPATVVDRIEMTETSEGGLEESAAERMVLWDQAKEVYAQNPIFGIGYFGFVLLRKNEDLHDTHNYYMRTAVEQGTIGLLLLSLLLLRAMLSGWQLSRSPGSPFQRSLGMAFMATTSALIVTNIFGDRFTPFAIGAWYWILWGAVDRSAVLARAAARAAVPAPAVIAPGHPATT